MKFKFTRDKSKQHTFIITGGLGFIGSNIVKWLFELKHKIYIFDINNSKFLEKYYNTLSKKEQELFNTNIIIKNKDIKNLNLEDCADIDLFDIDLIIHLASVVGVNNVIYNNYPTYDSLLININIMRIAKDYNIPVLFTSSSEIYNDNIEINNYSNIVIPNPKGHKRGGYAAQKIASEYMFKELDYNTVIRFFNITGPGQEVKSGMVLPIFIEKIRNNLPIQINKKTERLFTNINHYLTKDFLIDIILNQEIYNNDCINIGLSETITKRDDDINIKNLIFVVKCIIDVVNPNYDSKLIHYVDEIYNEEINKRIIKIPDNKILSRCFKNEEYLINIDYEIYLKELIKDINNYQE